jgi:hypothetical protein
VSPHPHCAFKLVETNRDYAATLSTAVKKWFWGPLCQGKIPRKFLFLEPNPLIGGMLAQLLLQKQFFPQILDLLNPSVANLWFDHQPMNLWIAAPGSDAPGEKWRPPAHITSGLEKKNMLLPLEY